jgi:hypothetical protein
MIKEERRCTMSRNIVDYLNDYRSIGYARERIITEMARWFKLVEQEEGLLVPACSEIESTEDSIKLTFLGRPILIRLDICAAEKVGLIKWFYPELQPDGKTITRLIIKDKFNKDSDLAANDPEPMGYAFGNMMQYCYGTLVRYLERVDERIVDEEVS